MDKGITLGEALNSLDAGNDEHWTKTGLPKLKVLKELTGNDDLTVAMVNERLYDGYNRVNVRDPLGYYSVNPFYPRTSASGITGLFSFFNKRLRRF